MTLHPSSSLPPSVVPFIGPAGVFNGWSCVNVVFVVDESSSSDVDGSTITGAVADWVPPIGKLRYRFLVLKTKRNGFELHSLAYCMHEVLKEEDAITTDAHTYILLGCMDIPEY